MIAAADTLPYRELSGSGKVASTTRCLPGTVRCCSSLVCPRQDSNLRHRLRRAVLYPLSYGGLVRPGEGYQRPDVYRLPVSPRAARPRERRAGQFSGAPSSFNSCCIMSTSPRCRLYMPCASSRT